MLNKRLFFTLCCSFIVLSLPMQGLALSYWSGGIGQESRAEKPSYNTLFEFFNRDGRYLTEVFYTLYDDQGEVLLEGLADGPWLAVALPSGTYSFKAERVATTEIQSIRFTVTSNQTQRILGLKFAG